MANFEYKNIDEILETNLPIRGIRINLEDNKLLDKKPVVPSVDAPPEPTDQFEFHTFFPNGAYVSSLYEMQTWKIDGTKLSMDIHRDMRATRNLPGTYKIVYNFFKNWVGGYNSPDKLFISDISSDRTELKLSLINPNSVFAIEQLKQFVLSYLRPTPSFPTIVLNFGQNKIVNVINVTPNVNFDGTLHSIYVKAYEPIPEDLDLFFECWIAEELMKPYIDTVNYIAEEIIIPPNTLRGPNLEADVDYWISTETEYKSWNDILSTNIQTSQEILDRYLYVSSSNIPVKLNVDFREFKNFIFYSSAEERVNNFVYKMELIERYNNELNLLNTFYTGSSGENKIKITNLRDKAISGFDAFEKWLYYETTASNYYTSQAGASITPYPKYPVSGSDYNIATKEGKYKFYSSGSNEVITWYENLIDIANDYDLKNYNALNKAIPDYLREDSENDQFTTFVNMIGQHFDIMYLYTDHILKKNLREQHPKDGLSQDLIYDATRNLGWTLTHGNQAKDLWEYALGVSGSGDPIWTGKTTTNKYLAKSEEERTKEVWRRIFNNLPYIYKTKGTARGVKALLAAYGIPQTLLTIREYGGPDNADLGVTPRAEWEKQTYFLNFSGNFPLPTKQHHVRVPWERVSNVDGNWQYPDTITFRWKMEPNKLYSYQADSVQTLLQKNSGSRVDWFVTMNKNGTDVEKGSIYFYIGDGTSYATASIIDEYFYDDIPLNLMIRRNLTNDLTSSIQTYDLIVKTGKYGKIAVERSASIVISGSLSGSYNRAWSSDGQLFIGSGSNSQTDKILSGSIFELRYWTNQLSTASFNNHVLSARSYNGNTETSSFYDLQAQWKFWKKFNVAVTTSISSSHPNQKVNYFYSSSKMAHFYNFDSSSFESIVETYNMEVATIANNTIYSEKVRIDSGSRVKALNKDEMVEISAFDTYSVDSDKLMIAFSPQSVINEDIYEAIGGVRLDDYIGDYTNISQGQYPHLKWLARQYWQKYPNKNDFNSYIDLISAFDFSVFEQIRQTLPARSNPILGLVIEPNILERSKVGNIGENVSGDTQNVFSLTELSSSVRPKLEYTDYKSNVKVITIESSDGEFEDIAGDTDFPKKKYIPTITNKQFVIPGNLTEIKSNTTNTKTVLDIPDLNTKTDYNNKNTIVDVPSLKNKFVYNNKNAEVNNPDLITKVEYGNKNTVLNISDLETKINYNNKNTVLDTPILNTFAEYKNKQISIDNFELVTNIEYKNKNTVIDTPDIYTNITYTNKTANILSEDLQTKIEYNLKEGNLSTPTLNTELKHSSNNANINSSELKTNVKYQSQFVKIDSENLENIEMTFSNFVVLIKNRNESTTYNVVGQYNTLQENGNQIYGQTAITASSTWGRNNVYKTSESIDYGYGIGWKISKNTTSRNYPLADFINQSRKDNFYKAYYLYYSSSLDISNRDFYSSSLISSNISNQELLTKGIQNNRFLGCKLIGPDINVNSKTVPGYKPVIEVNLVGSTEIFYNPYIGPGNLVGI